MSDGSMLKTLKDGFKPDDATDLAAEAARRIDSMRTSQCTGGLPCTSMSHPVMLPGEQKAKFNNPALVEQQVREAAKLVGGAARQRLVQALQCEDRTW
ncbi:hypothetical protein R0K19_21340, partial [Bacillus sp. SIMBA_161]